MSSPEPATESKRPRLLGVDFWRGLALLTIFVNHIPGNVFERFTHRNFGFSDATEIFVMLAGVAAALAYLPKFVRGRSLPATFRIYQRVFQLYMVHIFLIIICGAIIARAVMVSGDFRLFEAVHLDILINDTIPGLIGLASLGMQPAYLNILPLYIVLLVLAPALFLLARTSVPLMLAVSGGLYIAAQFLWLNLPTYPMEGNWFFNPLCWQFMFAIGIAMGALILKGEKPKRSPILFWGSVVYLLISMVWIVSGFWHSWELPLPRFIWEFDKTNLFLPRLLHALALTYVVAYLPVEKWLNGNALAQPFIMLGRHSLAVFSLGTVLAMWGQVVRAQASHGLALDILLISGGILAQFALAGVLEWYRSGTSVSAVRSQRA